MTSPFKAYLAGVGTVTVAIALGFGGGLLIAERFGSTTAVPEQTKFALARQSDINNSEKPAVTATKPAISETTGTAESNRPGPSPETFAPIVSLPTAAASPRTADPSPATGPHSLEPSANSQVVESVAIPSESETTQAPVPDRVEELQRGSPDEASSEQLEAEASPLPEPTAQRPSVAVPPQSKVHLPVAAAPESKVESPEFAAPPGFKAERSAAAAKSDTKRDQKSRSERTNERKRAARQDIAKADQRRQKNAAELQAVYAEDAVDRDEPLIRNGVFDRDIRPNREQSWQVRDDERRVAQERQAVYERRVRDEEDSYESADMLTERRRNPLSGVPLLGLFVR